VLAREVLKGTEYLIPGAEIEAITLEGKGIEIGTVATFRHCFDFSTGKQARAQTSAP
jgi:hypothetical protein